MSNSPPDQNWVLAAGKWPSTQRQEYQDYTRVQVLKALSGASAP